MNNNIDDMSKINESPKQRHRMSSSTTPAPPSAAAARMRIRSRVILPQIVTPTSSLKPVFVEPPTLKPIYPIKNPIVIPAEEIINEGKNHIETPREFILYTEKHSSVC